MINSYYILIKVLFVGNVKLTRHGSLLSLYLPVRNGGSAGGHGLRNGLVYWTKAHVNYLM